MPVERIPILPFEPTWLAVPHFDDNEIKRQCEGYRNQAINLKDKTELRQKLIKIIQLLDLTTLNGDDTPDKVAKLVDQALVSAPSTLIESLRLSSLHCAAVCVYPARIVDVIDHLKKINVVDKNQLAIASVAGGFPSGQYKIQSKIVEVQLAIEDGATEIDIVINRGDALLGRWDVVYDDVKQMSSACSNRARLKTILATGELVSNENIYKASMVAILAGSDFVKTSTGKETVNATLPVSWIMCQAVKHYFEKTGRRVGFKPAGGIRTADEALAFVFLVEDVLGKDWLDPKLFRIGASTLLGNVVKALQSLV